ncbi:MAG: hypothetical protein BWZ04_01342 [Firmicutes bacterium ADurb.BinA205]|nr:MAG: hypothetical protein BWZ04_01342 [Firmicutes bacterium ADurb.BinA205]
MKISRRITAVMIVISAVLCCMAGLFLTASAEEMTGSLTL